MMNILEAELRLQIALTTNLGTSDAPLGPVADNALDMTITAVPTSFSYSHDSSSL